MKLLETGGNARLCEYLLKYNLKDVQVPLKYLTNAMEFYRKRNKAKALGLKFHEEELYLEAGRTLIDGRRLDSEGKVTIVGVQDLL